MIIKSARRVRYRWRRFIVRFWRTVFDMRAPTWTEFLDSRGMRFIFRLPRNIAIGYAIFLAGEIVAHYSAIRAQQAQQTVAARQRAQTDADDWLPPLSPPTRQDINDGTAVVRARPRADGPSGCVAGCR